MESAITFRTIIADSSKLGSAVLERLLAPLLDVEVCRDTADLHQALARGARLLLIAHQWPAALESVLADARAQGIAVILMASPESDAARLATLSHQYGTGVIYRPYEARQVMREIMRQLSSTDSVSVSATSSPQKDDRTILQRDLAFCRRHKLPHSLLALRIDEYESLGKELGNEGLLQMEQELQHSISTSLRQEDHLCQRLPGRLVISLPGTPVQGARVLAHRLCDLVRQGDTGFTLLAGIHIVTARDSTELQRDIDAVLATCDLAESDTSLQVLLSETACEQQEQAIPLLREQESGNQNSPWTDLIEALDNQPGNSTVLEQLSSRLRGLDENTRLALVDELLLASSLPQT